jgi:hypothetical protein
MESFPSWQMPDDTDPEPLSRARSSPISIPLSQQSSYSTNTDSESDFSALSFSQSPTRPSAILKRKSSKNSADEMSSSLPLEEFASTSDRSGEFVEQSRVYHAIFGSGRVYYNDGIYLGIRFDDPRYNEMKLKVIFAVPKMMLMPE